MYRISISVDTHGPFTYLANLEILQLAWHFQISNSVVYQWRFLLRLQWS